MTSPILNSEKSYVKFYSKVLLFGEYAIIKNAKGLAMPCDKYFGVLKFSSSPADMDPDLILETFCHYLTNSGILSMALDLGQLESDIKNGLFFDSNIPVGHGIGSSGALCASIYYHYSYDFEPKASYTSEELSYLQDMMALMESYYHGTSSGLDCLISLINTPVIIESRNHLEICSPPMLSELGYFYLYDTKISRKTSPLVHGFLKRYEDDLEFQIKFNEFTAFSDRAINALVLSDQKDFTRFFLEISRWQYLNFSSMIPRGIKDLWLDGLETKKNMFKLCGAGGGGFFLVYSKDRLSMPNIIPLT